jgi:hypothetical protein
MRQAWEKMRKGGNGMSDPIQVAIAFSLVRLAWMMASWSFGLAAQRARYRGLHALLEAAGAGAVLSDDRHGSTVVIVSARGGADRHGQGGGRK